MPAGAGAEPGIGHITGSGTWSEPASAADAARIAVGALAWLANADVASVPVEVQAECLRELERAASVHTAAQASVLSAFDAAAGYEDEGQRSPRTWLRWQTRVTGAAAAGSVGWMRRLRAHCAVADALRNAEISTSWAKEICDWTDRLPQDARADADQILLAAAAGGAELADLAKLAEEMRKRLAEPDQDGDDDGFEDRQLRLQTTLGGAGRLDGDLTSRCAEAVRAVLDALGKKAGPEDTRTQRQRNHDALEEACRRLIAVLHHAGCRADLASRSGRVLAGRMSAPSCAGRAWRSAGCDSHGSAMLCRREIYIIVGRAALAGERFRVNDDAGLAGAATVTGRRCLSAAEIQQHSDGRHPGPLSIPRVHGCADSSAREGKRVVWS